MPQPKKSSFIALGVFHLLIGLGAMGGGFGAIMDPSGEAMGMSVDVLRNGPFDSFLVPGLFLFIVIGVGNVVGAITAFRNARYQGYVTGGLSGILVLWIVVQVYMLWDANYFHVLYFVIGLIGLLWGGILAFKQRLFPFNKLEEWHKVSDV
jgi:hypothetical protein